MKTCRNCQQLFSPDSFFTETCSLSCQRVTLLESRYKVIEEIVADLAENQHLMTDIVERLSKRFYYDS